MVNFTFWLINKVIKINRLVIFLCLEEVNFFASIIFFKIYFEQVNNLNSPAATNNKCILKSKII